MEARNLTKTASTDIRPFTVDVPGDRIDDLRGRIRSTRLPRKETVDDISQGVQLTTVEELTRYWGDDYEMGRLGERLNAFPQFVTEIDGLDIHFIHVKSPEKHALPVILTHGWPGSIVEMLEVIGPLSDPKASGGDAADAFDVVVPSVPGYGFSAQSAEVGWNAGRVAQAWAKLMKRLGYDRYVAQGGDLGAAVSDAMAVQAPEGLAGIHLNFLRRPPNELVASAFAGAPEPEGLTDEEHEGLDKLRTQFRKGYILEQGQSPQSIGFSLTDSPAGLAAWMLDHDTDSHLKIARAFVEGEPTGGLTRDHILDNITLYWVTATGASAARMYWENQRATAAAAAAGKGPPPEVTLPVAFTVFPGEIYRAPRSWAERVYPNLSYFNEVERGGHFAAWEEPEIFTNELRAAFRPLR
ncbi:MAG TPA: epoxide hydrolase [Solirubrobacterales bacterium]|nr:epoxide hydrolase [Solirubrobacterales bacterium]